MDTKLHRLYANFDEDTGPSLASLPIELLRHLVPFIRWNDRKSVLRTCKALYEVTKEPYWEEPILKSIDSATLSSFKHLPIQIIRTSGIRITPQDIVDTEIHNGLLYGQCNPELRSFIVKILPTLPHVHSIIFDRKSSSNIMINIADMYLLRNLPITEVHVSVVTEMQKRVTGIDEDFLRAYETIASKPDLVLDSNMRTRTENGYMSVPRLENFSLRLNISKIYLSSFVWKNIESDLAQFIQAVQTSLKEPPEIICDAFYFWLTPELLGQLTCLDISEVHFSSLKLPDMYSPDTYIGYDFPQNKPLAEQYAAVYSDRIDVFVDILKRIHPLPIIHLDDYYLSRVTFMTPWQLAKFNLFPLAKVRPAALNTSKYTLQQFRDKCPELYIDDM